MMLSLAPTILRFSIGRPQSNLRISGTAIGSAIRVAQLTCALLAFQRSVLTPRAVPYLAASNKLRILNSTESRSGTVVVGENLEQGYRFLRCDHSLLGGRWLPRGEADRGHDLGDSIFSTFLLQEACRLANHLPAERSADRSVPQTLIM